MELLIRTVHKHPVVATLHFEGSQAGDVIAICPDGWQWSPAERSNPDWIIISADLLPVEVEALLEPAREGEGRLRRRLGVRVDDLASGAMLSREQLMSRVF